MLACFLASPESEPVKVIEGTCSCGITIGDSYSPWHLRSSVLDLSVLQFYTCMDDPITQTPQMVHQTEAAPRERMRKLSASEQLNSLLQVLDCGHKGKYI